MDNYYGVKISKVSLKEQLKSLGGDSWVNLNQEQDNVSLCQKLEAKLEQDLTKEIKKVRLIYFPKEVDPKNAGLYFFKIPNQIYWKYTEDLNSHLTMANELKAEIEAKLKNGSDLYEKGWVCPKCRRVNAPWIASCPCSEYKGYWNQPIYPNYPNDYLTPGIPSDYPEPKTVPPNVIGPFVDNPSTIGPFVDSPNVIGPFVDNPSTMSSCSDIKQKPY